MALVLDAQHHTNPHSDAFSCRRGSGPASGRNGAVGAGMGGASGLPSSRPPEQDLKILCVRVAPSENCEDKPAGASWHSGTPMTQSKADAMISTPSPTMTSPPIVRSATSRVEEPASHSRAVPAIRPHVPSERTARRLKMTPSASSCPVTFPDERSMKWGNTATKKMSALGLSPPTTKPCWMTRDPRGLADSTFVMDAA